MKILALDAATEACSSALYLDGEVAERFELAPRRHAAILLPMAQGLLAQAGIALAQLDAIAFGHGPGSFTGIRIALGVAQGLALGSGRPVVGVSTLAALAARSLSGRTSGQAAVALDARMDQVYWAAYRTDGAGALTAADEALLYPQCAPRLAGVDWIKAGTGWVRFGDALSQATGLSPGVPAQLHPHAADIARLAVLKLKIGEACDATGAAPVYLRQHVAEKIGAQVKRR